MTIDPPSTITLIGYRGTGKSTVARLLADQLGFDWVDVDHEIEARAGKSIARLFAEDGEPAFRNVEANVVADLVQKEKIVIAAGGGSVLRPTSRQLITAAGCVVWLTATVETIFARLQHDPTTEQRRPSLTGNSTLDEIKQVLDARMPIYQSMADVCVATDEKSPEQIVSEILLRKSQQRN